LIGKKPVWIGKRKRKSNRVKKRDSFTSNNHLYGTVLSVIITQQARIHGDTSIWITRLGGSCYDESSRMHYSRETVC